MGHFFQAGGDEPGQADDVDIVFFGGIEDFLCRDHDAEVNHFEVVALQHHADDVLADVVDVALDGGHEDLALGLAVLVFFRFDVGQQVGDGFFHDARAFYHLGQEHFAFAE